MIENGTQTVIPVEWRNLSDKQLVHALTPLIMYGGNVSS
jgi:hypothetical protein